MFSKLNPSFSPSQRLLRTLMIVSVLALLALGAAVSAQEMEVSGELDFMGFGLGDEIATERVAGYTDPYVFALISKGRGLMPEYSRIPPVARWDIVNYLRTLPLGPATVSTTTAADTAAGAAPADTTAP